MEIHFTEFIHNFFFVKNAFDSATFSVERQLVDTVVDPGSGQGGAKHFSRDFADKVKQANIGRGPGPALGPLKLLHFYLSNIHSPTFLVTFLQIFTVALCGYITKYLFKYERFLAIFNKYNFPFLYLRK